MEDKSFGGINFGKRPMFMSNNPRKGPKIEGGPKVGEGAQLSKADRKKVKAPTTKKEGESQSGFENRGDRPRFTSNFGKGKDGPGNRFGKLEGAAGNTDEQYERIRAEREKNGEKETRPQFFSHKERREETDAKKEAEDSGFTFGGPRKFTNNKKKGMTMAQAQEEAQKKREDFEEEKPKKTYVAKERKFSDDQPKPERKEKKPKKKTPVEQPKPEKWSEPVTLEKNEWDDVPEFLN